jgi:hypothetical protein
MTALESMLEQGLLRKNEKGTHSACMHAKLKRGNWKDHIFKTRQIYG